MKRRKPTKRRPAKPARHRKPVKRAAMRRRKPVRRRKAVRRSRRVPRQAVTRAAPRGTGESLSADPAVFWSGGDLAGFTVDIAPAEVPGGTLRRLGPPPVGAEAGVVERTLRRTYAAAAAQALALARR